MAGAQVCAVAGKGAAQSSSSDAKIRRMVIGGSHRTLIWDDLNPAQRERLAETMLAWLENWGNAIAAARSLHVHPQTVRYRLRQINDLFPGDLQDPDSRASKLLADRRAYKVLEDLGTRPGVAYLKKIRHPEPT